MKRFAAVVALLAAACGSQETAEIKPVDGSVVLATFTGEVDTRNGTVTIRTDDSHAPGSMGALLEEITGVTVANDGGTTPGFGADCPGGSESLGVSVRIKANPHVSTTLWTDVYAQIQWTSATGVGGCNNATLPSGLTDYGLGLWYYPSLGGSNGVATLWAFTNPSGSNYIFTGKVYGTAVTVSDIKSVFVTSMGYNPNLGGVTGANAKCQARADLGISERNLPSGSTYWAFVATDTQDPFTLLADAAFVRPDGVIVALSKSQVTSTSIGNPIAVSELNTTLNANVWTGTSSQNCASWTAGDPLGVTFTGGSSYTDSNWVRWTTISCRDNARLYCFQQ